MNKHPYKRILISFLVGVFICFSNSSPVFPQSSLNGCLKEPGLCALLAGDKAVITASPNGAAAALAFQRLTPPVALLATGTAALYYMKANDYQQAKDSAVSPANPYYEGRWYVANATSSARITDNFTGTPINAGSILQSNHPAKDYLTGWGFFAYKAAPPDTRSYVEDYIGSTADLKFVPVPDSAYPVPSQTPTISDSSMMAIAAAAAAAAANEKELAGNLQAAIDAANSAIIAASMVSSDPLATEADKAKAAAAAAAAAATKDKALAKDPANPTNVKAGRINFVVYALRVFSLKFPFDFLYSPPVPTSFNCPSYTFFYYRFEFCFLVPLFTALRWIVTIAVSMKMIYTI